jgi:hypothetical protein
MNFRLPERVRQALLGGEQIVARVAARTRDGIAFVTVAQLTGHLDYVETNHLYRTMGVNEALAWMEANLPREYSVRYFEAPKDRCRPDCDIEDWELFHNEAHRRLKTIEEAEAVLERLPATPDDFVRFSEHEARCEAEGIDTWAVF